ncbi:hypothetical protein P171DRAFT_118412 [Karstenula rhodostoma CBS 690.94]|uniref:Cora-domain-containing protein n=1 Tax=Karstenula rhodostoma CBS 690.94 TaxID=1392251 RepID=A0A9P4PBK2_9PLEO|nr:hypothetical protein P171DRAFT_118412 [Karstenula rhodostoma CBS 690.94]
MSDPHPGSSDQHDRLREAGVRLLPHRSFVHEDLRRHLLKHQFLGLERELLKSVLSNKRLLQRPCLFHTGPGIPNDRSHYSHFQVYNVAPGGVVIHAEPHTDTPTSKALEYWSYIKDTPHLGTGDHDVVGRITIAREASPILLAALHLTHSPFMDMRSIFDALGAHESAAATCTSKIVDKDDGSGYTIQAIFSLAYHTIVGDECRPMEWQPHDEDVHAITKIRLSQCNTVVALTLFDGIEWESEKSEIREYYASRIRPNRPSSTWQVLNLQCFPDWKATTDAFENDHGILHGVEAFFTAVLSEFQDAKNRFWEVHNAIARLVTPSHGFIFRESLRDERLFDDASFVWTRQCFWALHVLAMIDKPISEMLKMATILPSLPYLRLPSMPKGAMAMQQCISPSDKRLQIILGQINTASQDLEAIIKQNAALKTQIQSLQSTLFNGTSVLESRRTVQQGENVKLLAMVNVFFLPLTFITSVFGMTNMPEHAGFARFGIVLVTVCLPLFGLIGFVSSHHGYNFIRKAIRRVWEWIKARVATRKEERLDHDPLRHRRRHRFSRKQSPPQDPEAPEEITAETETGLHVINEIEGPSHPHIKKMVQEAQRGTSKQHSQG